MMRGRRIGLVALAGLGFELSGMSFAQTQMQPVPNNPEYAAMLDAMSQSVKGRVLVFAPTISDLTLADALRQTALDDIRKSNVKIVTIAYYNYTAKSAALGLALANVPVYEVQTNTRSGIVIIDNQGWKGINLGTVGNPTIQRMSTDEINSSLTWFKNVIPKSKRISQLEAYSRIKKVLK